MKSDLSSLGFRETPLTRDPVISDCFTRGYHRETAEEIRRTVARCMSATLVVPADTGNVDNPVSVHKATSVGRFFVWSVREVVCGESCQARCDRGRHCTCNTTISSLSGKATGILCREVVQKTGVLDRSYYLIVY